MKSIRFDYKLSSPFDYMMVKDHTKFVPVMFEDAILSETMLRKDGSFLISLPDDLYIRVDAGKMRIHPCINVEVSDEMKHFATISRLEIRSVFNI